MAACVCTTCGLSIVGLLCLSSLHQDALKACECTCVDEVGCFSESQKLGMTACYVSTPEERSLFSVPGFLIVLCLFVFSSTQPIWDGRQG